MSDLVELLRADHLFRRPKGAIKLRNQAADEIERLEKKVERLRQHLDKIQRHANIGVSPSALGDMARLALKDD